jgi:hypothetical protein
MMRLRAKIRKVDGSGTLCVGSGLRRWRVAGSIPDDIGREKQNELTRQLVRARHDLAELEAASTDIQETLNDALDIVRDRAALTSALTLRPEGVEPSGLSRGSCSPPAGPGSHELRVPPGSPPHPLPGLPMDLRIRGPIQLGRHRLAVG